MVRELNEQQLLSSLHNFFKTYNGKHMETRTQLVNAFEHRNPNPTKKQKEDFKKSIEQGRLESDKFTSGLYDIMFEAIKSWGLKKTQTFVDKHAWDFADYDIKVGTTSMADVKKDKRFSILYGPIYKKQTELQRKARKILEDKFSLNMEKDANGKFSANDFYTSGPGKQEKRLIGASFLNWFNKISKSKN